MGPLGLGQPRLGQHPIDRGVVHAQLLGNGAHPPLLHMEVTQDLRFELRGYRQCRVLLVLSPPPTEGSGTSAPCPNRGRQADRFTSRAPVSEPLTNKLRTQPCAQVTTDAPASHCSGYFAPLGRRPRLDGKCFIGGARE